MLYEVITLRFHTDLNFRTMRIVSRILFVVMLPVWYGCLEATDTYLYEDSESELVVEGRITNAKPPYFVRITKSVSPKFENNSLAIVSAKVVIADETGFEEQLTGIGNGYRITSYNVCYTKLLRIGYVHLLPGLCEQTGFDLLVCQLNMIVRSM